MLIGTRYSENKLYKGLKYYDKLPLTSSDRHEETDLSTMKSAYLFNNLLGSGTLNEPPLKISATGVSLVSPSVLLINGDISLVQSDAEFLNISDIRESGIFEGYICVVGWYQHLNSYSTLRAYGGVNNSILPNDILDTELGVQTSTRYQLRWDTVLLGNDAIASENISFSIYNRDDTGEISSGTSQLVTTSIVGNMRVAEKPSTMDYAVSDIYLIPILKYKFDDTSSAFQEVSAVTSVKPPEPELVQYTRTIKVPSIVSADEDLIVSIGIENYDSTEDIIQILYEDILLTEGVHYSLDPVARTVTLSKFATYENEQITFILTKLEYR